MNWKSLRYILLTLGMYVVLAALSWVLGSVSPSGPCNPGLGVLVILFIPLLCIPAFFISLGLTITGRKAHRIPMIIHGLVCLGFLALWLRVR